MCAGVVEGHTRVGGHAGRLAPPLAPTIPAHIPINKQTGVLYTEAFERMQAARARGVCAGITRPGKHLHMYVTSLIAQYHPSSPTPHIIPHTVTIPQLLADHPDLDESVLLETLAELIKAQTIPGTLRGREFIPAAFSRTQRACVDAFFAQNGYLEFARAQRLKVRRIYGMVEYMYVSGVNVLSTL